MTDTTDPRELVDRLRLAANGCISLKSHKGDYGLCDDAADALTAAQDRIEALEAENAAGLRREKDANERAMKHLRRAEKAEIASKNHAAFSREWRERAERTEAENATLRTEKHADAEAIGHLRAENERLRKVIESLAEDAMDYSPLTGNSIETSMSRYAIAALKGQDQ